jgi:hypothetical protein
MTGRTQQIFRKLFEADEMNKLIRVQSCMRAYLASKQANRMKYGCYEFKEFNEECQGDYTNELVDKVVSRYGPYKLDKAYERKFAGSDRRFKGKEVQENGAQYQGEYDEKND